MQIESIFERRRFVFLDGAMGTQLQKRGLKVGQKPELAALEMPEVLTSIHAEYVTAGADLLLANTFGANARKLAGTGYSVAQVVEASLACARKAAEESGVWLPSKSYKLSHCQCSCKDSFRQYKSDGARQFLFRVSRNWFIHKGKAAVKYALRSGDCTQES